MRYYILLFLVAISVEMWTESLAASIGMSEKELSEEELEEHTAGGLLENLGEVDPSSEEKESSFELSDKEHEEEKDEILSKRNTRDIHSSESDSIDTSEVVDIHETDVPESQEGDEDDNEITNVLF